MMQDGIFVTGGSGFVGRRLLPLLASSGRPVFVLTRQSRLDLPAGVTAVHGDLLTPETYRDALAQCRVVVHLAAATGKVSAGTHHRVNAEGTRVLIDLCQRAGVQRLLFVSSIATTFPDRSGYHYALAKAEAERAVESSGLAFTILRPTIILGPGAPLFGSLRKLAALPIFLVPGTGRIQIQPIHVDDVARSVAAVVQADRFQGEVLALGGPEVVSMDHLLRRIRHAATGRAGTPWHIPLGLIQTPLAVAEALGLGGMLPISAGQLTSFRFDGVAGRDGLTALSGDDLIGVERMVADSAALSAAPANGPALETDAQSADELRRECERFTRHVIGSAADPYLIEKYLAAHAAVPTLSPRSRFDRLLVAFATGGALATRLADAYAAVFARASALRQKLVLLLALLEVHPPSSIAIDQPVPGSLAMVLARVGVRAAWGAFLLLAGTIALTPPRVALAFMRSRPSS